MGKSQEKKVLEVGSGHLGGFPLLRTRRMEKWPLDLATQRGLFPLMRVLRRGAGR